MEKIKRLEFKNKKFKHFKTLGKIDFNFLSQIGAGSFGKVYKVAFKSSGEIFALKVLS